MSAITGCQQHLPNRGYQLALSANKLACRACATRLAALSFCAVSKVLWCAQKRVAATMLTVQSGRDRTVSTLHAQVCVLAGTEVAGRRSKRKKIVSERATLQRLLFCEGVVLSTKRVLRKSIVKPMHLGGDKIVSAENAKAHQMAANAKHTASR